MSTDEGTASDTQAEDPRAFTPSTAVVERAELAHKELATRGVEVSVKTMWWKFEVHLNAEGAALAAEIAPLIGEVVAAFLKEPIGTIVEIYAELRGEWIKQVADGGPVKLVSPWLAPGMLIPVKVRVEDYSLYWNVYEPANGWSESEKFVGQMTAENPALAMFRDKIYCLYRGSHERHLFSTVYDPDRGGWSPGTQLPGGYASPSSPAVAVYNDKLYLVHRAEDGKTMFWNTFDGTRWSTPRTIGTQQTSAGPGLAVYNNQLYCVYRGTTAQMFWTRFDGNSWNNGAQTGRHSSHGPALIAGKDKNSTVAQLMCVHRGVQDLPDGSSESAGGAARVGVRQARPQQQAGVRRAVRPRRQADR
ncbi:hypothetical protein [Streptomyces sp. NPDC003032]